MSKLITRASVAGSTLAGAALKSSLTGLIDALNSAGIQENARTTITATATLTMTQCGLVLVDATAGNVVLTLTASGTATDDAIYLFRRIDASANTVTIQRNGADTVEGAATAINLVSNGIIGLQMPAGATNWRMFNQSASTIAALLLQTGLSGALQTQTPTAFTSAGTQPAYTLTPVPAIAALAANQRFRVKFHAATSGACTLAVSGTTATSIKQYDLAGNKIDPVVAAGQLADIEYDGASWMVLDPLPTATPMGMRQTVLSGPVDTNGLPLFGGATGSSTVTASGTLIASAANGFTSAGNKDYLGSITNPSWTGLSTNGTMSLGLTIASNGTCTPFVTALAPVYQWGGAAGIANGQRTFNIQAMLMQVGNGATAAQSYDVMVGEVTVAGAVVTAITWYALMGRYEAPFTNTLPSSGSTVSMNHNIGDYPRNYTVEIQNLTTELGYPVGARVNTQVGNTSGVYTTISTTVTKKTIGFFTPATANVWQVVGTGGVAGVLTLANWAYRLIAYRGW